MRLFLIIFNLACVFVAGFFSGYFAQCAYEECRLHEHLVGSLMCAGAAIAQATFAVRLARKE